MIQLRNETTSDIAPRERLLDACFGAGRLAKTSQRLREGRLPAQGLSLTASQDGRLVGTVRLWHVAAAGPEGAARPALLLGPLAVDPAVQGCGLGAGLMRTVLGRARALGHGAVLLVGDAPYYARFGFRQSLTEGLSLPGPFERARFLGLELIAEALAGTGGILRATGALDTAPIFAAETAAMDARRQAA